jgi:hypothetical protein
MANRYPDRASGHFRIAVPSQRCRNPAAPGRRVVSLAQI